MKTIAEFKPTTKNEEWLIAIIDAYKKEIDLLKEVVGRIDRVNGFDIEQIEDDIGHIYNNSHDDIIKLLNDLKIIKHKAENNWNELDNLQSTLDNVQNECEDQPYPNWSGLE
jgi:hypothetical protein